ncbi:4'-phosphopantetheinyl transferase superfamily protein [Eubacterium sp. 1001713B170207_170306_E7]|uniref:4'-phosphopantetheinyl transferase family protein n=1 Tax=Eubacterium sp. 1001713B170207_170306_E7 TaxID=2787097 RepID=UPI00189847D7|nr:4'-phosphopantetheinyl transferase superfamily protein [Eubacterium sp. 1001713B170207_170306_E7]
MIDVYTLDTHFFSLTGKTVHVEVLLNKIFEKKKLPTPVKIEKNRYGKPFLKQYPGLHFNGSHSGDYLVCAVSEKPVGVDVQRIDKTKQMMPLARRFMAPEEIRSLESLENDARTRAFYRLWAQKESYMKYRGLGFALPLSAFEIQEKSGEYLILDANCQAGGVFLRRLELSPDYELWVCGEEPAVQKIEFGVL